MTTRRTTRSMGEAPPIITDIDDKPIRTKRLAKTRTTTEIPGTEYVSNFRIGDCESDSDGLKGEVFAQFVYNKLKNVD